MIIAITTAPREIPTLNACIKALRDAGYSDKIYIFSEPGIVNISANNVEIYIHNKKLGAFDNYDFVLNWFINKNDDEIIIMQDDLIVCNNFIELLSNREKIYGYYNLLTVAEHPKFEDFIKTTGWNKCELGRWAWGACYLMQKEVVKHILKNEYYIKHKQGLSDGTKGQMIDGCISQSLKLMNLPMYYHNPSITQHIGVSSTLEHNEILTGYKWEK